MIRFLIYIFIFLLFLLLLRPRPTECQNQLITTQFGETTVKIIYNGERGSNDTFIVVKYLADVKELYLMKVNADATVKSISCRQDSFKSIIYGAIGCSDPFDPSKSLVADNCLDSNIEVTRRRNIFRETWYLDKDSNECYLKGGAGGKFISFNPIRDRFFLTYISTKIQDYVWDQLSYLVSML